MFARKLVLTSCLAIAASMLAGCASYKNESGLPKWLDDASEANRLGYFMGISRSRTALRRKGSTRAKTRSFRT